MNVIEKVIIEVLSDRVVLFFFKQKTAYEMRISDWSSDVCSSDLIRGELERSVDRGEIAVVYQPIVQLGSRKLVGFEALAHWRHPERGAISPVEFIPIDRKSVV